MQILREQFDKENIYDIIKNIPAQLTQSLRETKISFDKQPEKIVFCGMGGSASPANLLKNYLAVAKINFNIPIKIVRSYNLPTSVDSTWSGFFSSYSGNTEETLAALAEAKKRNLKEAVLLAHGGELKEIAEKENRPLIEIPDFAQPRMGYLYVVGALLKVLENSNLINLDQESMEKDIESLMNNETPEKVGQKLAKSLQGTIPIIYSSTTWESLAMVWKINFNENAKVPSFWHTFPELNHNEMVGYTHSKEKFKAIILKDAEDDERINKRITVFEKIFGEKLKIEVIEMPSGSPLYKMVYTLLIGLWASYYLALLNNIDPAPVVVVEKFKRLLTD
jgi:glucose/mannose-6-phosphate isomerase